MEPVERKTLACRRVSDGKAVSVGFRDRGEIEPGVYEMEWHVEGAVLVSTYRGDGGLRERLAMDDAFLASHDLEIV